MISRTNIVLAVLLGIVVLLAAMSRVDYSVPNVEVLADLSMKYTPASTAYEPSEVFANGMTQQAPVPGTIARGQMPLHFAPLPKEADPKAMVPGKELVNPFSLEVLLRQTQLEFERDEAARKAAAEKNAADVAKAAEEAKSSEEAKTSSPASKTPKTAATDMDVATPATGNKTAESKPAESKPAETPEAVAARRFQASVDRGNDIFLAFCACCHGPAGTDPGMVAMRGYTPPPRYFQTAKSDGTPNEWNDGQLFHIVTYGRLNMPQFEVQLPPESRWDAINYVRTLQKAAVPPADEKPGDNTESDSATAAKAELKTAQPDDKLRESAKAKLSKSTIKGDTAPLNVDKK